MFAFFFFFFFNDTATTEIYTLSLHDALPIRGARPGRGAAAPVALVPRVQPRTVPGGVRVVVPHAARELDHRKLGRQDGPGLLETLDDRRVVTELLVAVGLGAPGRRHRLRGEQVLSAVGNAVEQPAPAPGADLLFGFAGAVERFRAGEGRDGVQLSAFCLEPLERNFGQGDGRDRLRADTSSELGDRREEIGSHLPSVARRRSGEEEEGRFTRPPSPRLRRTRKSVVGSSPLPSLKERRRALVRSSAASRSSSWVSCSSVRNFP